MDVEQCDQKFMTVFKGAHRTILAIFLGYSLFISLGFKDFLHYELTVMGMLICLPIVRSSLLLFEFTKRRMWLQISAGLLSIFIKLVFAPPSRRRCKSPFRREYL